MTGNKGKLKEFQAIIGDTVTLDNIDIDLPEYQGTPEYIASEKVKLAYSQVKKPLITEDTSLIFNALNGMPGPYIKDFYKALKNEGLYKLLAGHEDKTAVA